MFEIGQEVWFEPDDTRDRGREMVISKIGRVYYTATYFNGWGTHRFSIDNNSSIEFPQGKIYSSRQEAIDTKKAKEMYLELCRSKMYLKPTLQQMIEVYKVLGLEVQDVSKD